MRKYKTWKLLQESFNNTYALGLANRNSVGLVNTSNYDVVTEKKEDKEEKDVEKEEEETGVDLDNDKEKGESKEHKEKMKKAKESKDEMLERLQQEYGLVNVKNATNDFCSVYEDYVAKQAVPQSQPKPGEVGFAPQGKVNWFGTPYNPEFDRDFNEEVRQEDVISILQGVSHQVKDLSPEAFNLVKQALDILQKDSGASSGGDQEEAPAPDNVQEPANTSGDNQTPPMGDMTSAPPAGGNNMPAV